MKKCPTKQILHNCVDERWSIDLADFSGYKTTNNKGCRYIFVIIDNFSKYLCCLPLENKNSQTITNDFSNILTKSKRSAQKIESDRGAKFFNSFNKFFSKVKNFQHFSSFTD